MPITVRCAECFQVLQVEDQHANKQVKCPQCGNVMRVQAQKPPPQKAPPPPQQKPRPRPRPAPEPEPLLTPPPISEPGPSAANPFDFDERPPKSSSQRAAKQSAPFDWSKATEEEEDSEPLPEGWENVVKGLGFQILGIRITLAALGLGALGLIVVVALAFARMPPGELGFLMSGIGALLVLALLAGSILSFVGMCFCIGVPEESGLRMLAILGVVLMFLLGPVGMILWIFFLRGVALAFRNRLLAKQIMMYFITTLVLPVIACGLTCGAVFLGALTGEGAQLAGPLMGILQVVNLIVALILAFWYLGLLTDLRKTVVWKLKRRG